MIRDLIRSEPGSRALDRGVALALAAAYVALLLASTGDLGYARDEGFYFQAARAYRGWLDLLFHEPSVALTRANVDRFWAVNHEHPALMKLTFALCHQLFYEQLALIPTPGSAYRLGGMLVSSLGVAVTFLWGSRAMGRWGGLLAALSLALMPRVFFHSHLAAFDMPVAALWLTTAYAYQRSLEKRSYVSALLAALCFGLLLNTKHNAWLLPIAICLHFALAQGHSSLRRLRAGEWPLPRALGILLLLGPLLFYAGWPWIWFDTLERLTEYVAFHTGHEYYNMEFLGRTYWKPPMPLAYAWLMTLATVPLATLLLFTLGVFDSAQAAWRSLRTVGATEAMLPGARTSTDLLWLLAVLINYLPWLSANTPIFGGTKHWLTAYPFLCLLAARGFFRVAAELAPLVRGRPVAERWVKPLAFASFLLGPLLMTAHSHPWGLSFYTPLVGGAPGAATLGFNRTFWGYTTQAVSPYLNRRAPPDAHVYVHDTALQSWDMFVRDGRLRSDLHGTLAIHASQLALYHHEPHMGRVEYQIWVDYGTTTPALIATYDGVPITWVYERPR